MNTAMTLRKLWILLIFLVACAPAAQQPIKIGVVVPLTGNLANAGADERLGLEIARDEINAAGGVNGRQIELIFEDGKCDPKSWPAISSCSAYAWPRGLGSPLYAGVRQALRSAKSTSLTRDRR